MNALDIGLLVGAGVFTLLGLYWGVIRQVLSIVGLLVGLVLAGRYGPDVAIWLSSFIADPLLAGVIGFIAVLILVSSIASLIASVLRLFVGLLFLGWLDHALGGALGLVQAVLAGVALLIAMVTFPLPAWDQLVAESQFAEALLRLSGPLTALLPEFFTIAVRAALGT
ncbi:MAG: CvpA family protein [Oscillochloris sp.]|nr:CvpA family protein [Oscillochloris sp.]